MTPLHIKFFHNNRPGSYCRGLFALYQFKSCFLQNFLLPQYIPAQMAMARMRYTGFFSELTSDWPKRAIMATITALPARRVSR